MDIVTIDFETYYGKDYSLTKQTTEEYIRDPRFEVIGLGVKLGDYPTTWYSGDRPDKFLSSLDFSNKAVLAHNCMFDAAVLSWHFGIKPARWLDTLSMARPVVGARTSLGLARLAEFFGLGAKGDEVYNAKEKRRADFTPEELERYAEYCVNDVDLTYQLYQRLVDGFPEDELRLIDMTIRMFAEPVFTLDVKILREHLGRLQTKKANALATLDLDDDVEDIRGTLMSNPKFAELLRSYGVEPPKKISATTGRSTYAFSKTDSGFLELLNHEDERVKQAATARLETKSTLEETRTERFIGVAGRGPLPVALNYYGAHTGRFSGGDKQNLQNLPRTSPMRAAMRAPDGYKLVICDLSQIEARMVAWLAGQDDLIMSFELGDDVYSQFATKVYRREITKADKTERFVGKVSILSLQYGVGWRKFQHMLSLGGVDVDEQEAKEIVALYRNTYTNITELWDRCGEAISSIYTGQSGHINNTVVTYDGDGLRLPSGFLIQYPALQMDSDDEGRSDGFSYISDARSYMKEQEQPGSGTRVRLYGAKVTENLSQALARIVMTEHMLKIADKYRIILQVHDEVVVLVPAEEAKKAATYIENVMSTPPTWAPDLPVACEYGLGDSFGEGH